MQTPEKPHMPGIEMAVTGSGRPWAPRALSQRGLMKVALPPSKV